MSVNFPLEPSFTYESSTPIDNVRQSTIDLKIDHSIQMVEYVLENAFLALDTNLEYSLLNEISSLIKLCFSYYPDQLSQFFNQLLEKSHTKFNYIYTLPFIFLNSPKFHVEFDSKTFFNDCLQQIFQQLQKNSKNITLFDQEIPPQFSSTFLINLFLLADITKEMLPIISGFIFSQENYDSEKIESFIQKVIDLDMISFLSPDIYSNSRITNNISTEYLYKTCTYLSENFFREKFVEIQKVCLKFGNKDPKYLIPFISKSLGYNMKFDISINNFIIDLINYKILTPLNFQWYKDFNLLETKNLVLFDGYLSFDLSSEMTFWENPQFWANLITCLMNSEKTTFKKDFIEWDLLLYSYSVRFNANVFFDSIILSCFPLNRDITSRLVKILRDFQKNKKKKFYSIEHQTDLLSKVIKFEKVPYPQFWELISNKVICSVAKDKIHNGEEIEPLLLYAVDYVQMKIKNKCDVVFEKLKILLQNDESIQKVIDFVQSDNLLNLFGIPIQSLSLIISASIFRNSKQKIIIDEPNKIDILLLYLLTKDKEFQCPENYEFLSQNFTEFLSNNEFLNLYKNSPFFVKLIELLPDSNDLHFVYTKLCKSIINNENDQDSCIILRKIYALSNNSNTVEIDNFFNENSLKLIEFSIENLYKMNLNFSHKFNFNCIKQPEIKQQIINMIENKSNIDVSQMKYFISKICLNSPKIDFEKIENIERSADDIVSIILKFDYSQSESEQSCFYSNIFHIFMKERSNALKYFNIIFEKLRKTNAKVTPKIILENYKNYYIKYENYFIESFNFNYVYNIETNKIIQRCSQEIEQIQNSEKSLSIISKLIESIKRDCKNYHIMSVLRNIACSFPFLFESNTTELFEFVLSNINPDMNVNTNDQMSTISLYFLQSCLYSTKILNDFINWLFSKLTTFNNSQTIQFLMLFNSLFVNPSDSMKKVLIAYITKFNFIDKFTVLLNKDLYIIGQTNQYRKIIVQLLNNFYSMLIDVKDFDSVFIDELQNDDNPAKCVMNYTIMPTSLNPKNVDFFEKVDGFYSKSYDFYIFSQIPTMKVDSNEIKEFISKIKSEKQPKFIKMMRYFVHQPLFVNSIIDVNDPVFSENFSIISKTIKDFEEIYNEDDDQENCELEKVKQKLFSANLSKNLLILIIKIKTIFDKNKINIGLIKTFLNIFKKSKELLTFVFETISELCHDNSLINFADLIDLILYFSDSEFFVELFEKTCIESLIEISLLPKYRNNENVIHKIIILFAKNNIKIPNRLLHFVNFVFLSGKKKSISEVFEIVKKIDAEKLCYISDSIRFSFISLLEKEKEVISTDLITKFIDIVPSLIKENGYEILKFLGNHLNDLKNNEFIIKMLKLLAPKRIDTLSNYLSDVITISESTTENEYFKRIIPEKFFNSFPIYWQIFENFFTKINCEQFFDFIPIYPELFSFNERLFYFKKNLKSLRKNKNISFSIDRSNLIESSIDSFKKLSHDDMLKNPKVQFLNERGSDYGGLTKDWLTNLTSELFNPKNGYFDLTENKNCFQPNKNCIKFEYFKFAGQIVAFSIINEVYINAYLVKSFIKQILHHEVKFTDLEFSDGKLFNSLSWILENKIENELEIDFTIIDSKNEETGNHEVIELVQNGKDKLVTDSNKNEYVNLIYKHYLHDIFKDQIKAFCDGFDSLIPHEMIRFFTSSELALIICGTPKIDVEDFKRNTTFEGGYNKDSPTIKYFFSAISKWNQNDLAKLLLFFTGSSQVPATGFVEFTNSRYPITICYYNCSTDKLPVSHTCFNKIDLPPYESEELLNRKLLFVVNECNDFGLA